MDKRCSRARKLVATIGYRCPLPCIRAQSSYLTVPFILTAHHGESFHKTLGVGTLVANIVSHTRVCPDQSELSPMRSRKPRPRKIPAAKHRELEIAAAVAREALMQMHVTKSLKLIELAG